MEEEFSIPPDCAFNVYHYLGGGNGIYQGCTNPFEGPALAALNAIQPSKIESTYVGTLDMTGIKAVVADLRFQLLTTDSSVSNYLLEGILLIPAANPVEESVPLNPNYPA